MSYNSLSSGLQFLTNEVNRGGNSSPTSFSSVSPSFSYFSNTLPPTVTGWALSQSATESLCITLYSFFEMVCYNPFILVFFWGGGTPCGFWDLKSPTRGWIHLLAVEALSPNHWITREATSPNSFFIWETGPQRDKGIWSGSCFIRGMRASGFSSEPSLRPWGFVVTICHVKVLNGTCLIWKYVVTVFF